MSRKLMRLAGVVMAVMLVGCSVRTDLPPNGPDLISHGQQIYVEFCAECHQTDGMGWSNLFPRLAGNPIVTLHDPTPIIETVTYGQGSMMAFGPRLTPDDIASVLSYIRNSWGNEADPVSPRQVH